MSDRYQVEALLRPAVELWSVYVAVATAAIAVMAPGVLFMPESVAYATAVALLLFIALPRYRRARRVMVYQRNLKRLPSYWMRSTKIPVSRKTLFFGLGFRWEQKHTQRLRDTLRPEARAYLEPRRGFHAARYLERAWGEVWGLSLIAAWLGRASRWNPWPPRPKAGGNPAIHAIEPDETKVHMQLSCSKTSPMAWRSSPACAEVS